MTIHILNKNHGKSAGRLMREYAQSLDRRNQRRHEFWILTCYVDLDLIEKYSDYLLGEVRLTDIYLAFNFSEIYKKGPKDTNNRLLSIQDNLKVKGINFEWRALASSKLVHSKGYALIQRASDEVAGGVTLTTSANFTAPGFKGENVEIGYVSTKKKDIKDFESAYDYLWDALGSDMDSAVLKQEEYLLKFALLSSGLFLHKWSGTLSQQIGIRYKLTPLAKEKGTIAPELAAVGFEAGDTFTRQVLNMGALPEKEIPRSFVTRFTIETYWGRWCPADAWNTLSNTFEGASQFIDKFQMATEDGILEQVISEATVVQAALAKAGLIEPVKQDHLESWADRIRELRSNHRRLERFFIGYEAHELPYSIEQISDVTELFESLREAIELSRATNIAKEKVILAIEEADPDFIRLTDEELQIVSAMNNDA